MQSRTWKFGTAKSDMRIYHLAPSTKAKTCCTSRYNMISGEVVTYQNHMRITAKTSLELTSAEPG
jgi:hypothetical protein